MKHLVNYHYYEGSLFKCAYCGRIGLFIFYPQMHNKCWEEACNKVKFCNSKKEGK